MARITIFFVFIALSRAMLAQVLISSGNDQPHSSSMLEVRSTDKGFLPPRMTCAEMNAIDNPATGLIIFCTDCGTQNNGALTIYFNGIWNAMQINCPFPGVPTAGVHAASLNQITWNWNTIPNATGYKWNTSGDYTTATDMGAETTKTEADLQCSTTYIRYVWAYNDCGHSIPLTMTATTSPCAPPCPGIPTVLYSGKTYNTVRIGNQCWMKENLDVGTMVMASDQQTDNSIIEKYCQSNQASNCDTFGGLYQWGEVVQYFNGASNTTTYYPAPTGYIRGICPEGWHIPSNAEFDTLASFLGGWQIAGGKMKEAGFSHWHSPNSGADNSSGFTALGAGDRASWGSFYDFKFHGSFYSTDDINPTSTTYWNLYYYGTALSKDNISKAYGWSVRCIKDI